MTLNYELQHIFSCSSHIPFLICWGKDGTLHINICVLPAYKYFDIWTEIEFHHQNAFSPCVSLNMPSDM